MSVEEEHAYTNCIIYVFNYVNRGTQNRNRSQIKEKKNVRKEFWWDILINAYYDSLETCDQ